MRGEIGLDSAGSDVSRDGVPLEVLVSAEVCVHADGGSVALPGHDDRDDGVFSVVYQAALLSSLLMRT